MMNQNIIATISIIVPFRKIGSVLTENRKKLKGKYDAINQNKKGGDAMKDVRKNFEDNYTVPQQLCPYEGANVGWCFEMYAMIRK